MIWRSLWTLVETSSRSKERTDWTVSRRRGLEAPGIASSHLISYPTASSTSLDDYLRVTEPKVAAMLPPDVKNAEQLEFDAKDVILLFKEELKIPHVRWNFIQHITAVGQRFRHRRWVKHNLHIIRSSYKNGAAVFFPYITCPSDQP